jgi:hypothetical protein
MPPFLDRIIARLSITGIIIAVLALLLMVQTVRIEGFSVWPVHVHGLRERLKSATDEIATAKAESARLKAEQDKRTSDNISKSREGMREVEGPAKRVETAKLPGNCKTPSEVIQADL